MELRTVKVTLKMLRIIVILAHLSVLCMGDERVGYPGYDDFPEVKGWLKLHVEPTTWTAARTNCHNEGALLASPWLPEFEPAVRKLLSTRFHTIPKVYSGAGLRTDSAGIPLEPCANKRCRAFLAAGGMDKVRCDDLLPYVCYAPKPASPSCKNGYEFKIETGECYKYHSNPMNHMEADAICISEGAVLAYISSDVEQQMLQAMTNNRVYGANINIARSYPFAHINCGVSHPFVCEDPWSLTSSQSKPIGDDYID